MILLPHSIILLYIFNKLFSFNVNFLIYSAKSKKKSKDVGNHRRPFGVAVFDINKYYKQLSDDNTASGEPRWSPPPLNIYTTKNRDAIETLFSTLHW